VLLVAYTNEEPPFFGSDGMGSAVHAEGLAASRRDVRGMICLEMIGYYTEKQTWPNGLFALMYPSKGDFIAVAGGWSDRKLARHVKRGIAGARIVRAVSFSGPTLPISATTGRMAGRRWSSPTRPSSAICTTTRPATRRRRSTTAAWAASLTAFSVQSCIFLRICLRSAPFPRRANLFFSDPARKHLATASSGGA
jgi:hypothetical protein